MLSKVQRMRRARAAPEPFITDSGHISQRVYSSDRSSAVPMALDRIYGTLDRTPEEKFVRPLSPLMRELYNYMEFDVLYTQRGLARALSRVSVRQQLEGLHYRYMVDKEVSDMGAVFWRKR